MDPRELIHKHQRTGVLIDANLLVLLFVGLVNPARIANFKRTSNFTIEDFDLLARLVDWFAGNLFSTPHILSQLSDLADLRGPELPVIRAQLRSAISLIGEYYDPAKTLVKNQLFDRFGLADASIAAVCERNILVITADLNLWAALQNRGLDALNFNHFRQLGWK